jgi:LytS/YehU family sensor histidine kinase
VVTLRDELATVGRYIDVERLRFGNTLRVQESVEPDALEAYVPGLILQPLVENAVRHGIGRTSGEGLIRITAAVDNGRLRIGVTNPLINGLEGTEFGDVAHHSVVDGEGDRARSTPFGVRYVRERLDQFYGAAASFDLVVGKSESTATLDLPFATAGAPMSRANHPVVGGALPG